MPKPIRELTPNFEPDYTVTDTDYDACQDCEYETGDPDYDEAT